MSNLQIIEKSVKQLSKEELQSFRNWFAKYDAEIWDRRIEQDVENGKLNDIAQAALKDFKNGNFKQL